MLTLVLGDRGSGKTLWLTMMALKSNREIWSNYEIYIERFKKLREIDIMDLPPNIEVMIDEAYTWLESRLSMRGLNRYMSYIIYQLRKSNRGIFLSAQDTITLDVRARNQIDYLVYCQRKPNENKDWRYWDFKYEIACKRTNRIRVLILKYEKAIPYFEYFDTYEIVEPLDKQILEYQIIKDNPEMLKEKVDAIVNEIEPYLNKITHDTVRLALMNAGYPTQYSIHCYTKLKGNLNNKQMVS